MSQGKLSFKATKLKRPASLKAPFSSGVSTEVTDLKDHISALHNSPVQNKRKYESSPDVPPPTGHTKSKRAGKRTRRTKISHSTCKTLLHYMTPEKVDAPKSAGPSEKIDNVPILPSTDLPGNPSLPVTLQDDALDLEDNIADEEPSSMECESPIMTDKATQQEEIMSTAKTFLKKICTTVAPDDVKVNKRVTPKTTGGRMLAASLMKRKEGVPAHKNEVMQALAGRQSLCHRHKISEPKVETPASATKLDTDKSEKLPEKQRTNLTARQRFAHLLQPTSPKIKPFNAITVKSPSKSPSKAKAPSGLILPELHKRLHNKFNTSDQVINLLARRLETCTFGKLQKNVQEICRKRFTEDDLSHIIGTYPEAYILNQNKGLSQIKNDRTIRNEYQLTIAFNYVETEFIKKMNTTDIFGLHPALKTSRKIDFEVDDNTISHNEQISLKQAKEKAEFNQRGLMTAELLERNKRFKTKIMDFLRAMHQQFLSTLVPALKINDDKLVRWHPEFDLNALELPPKGDLPNPPESSRLLSATQMLNSIDANKSQPPPGMTKAIDTNYQKILAEKKEIAERQKDDQLKDIDQALVARIRAKEAKKMAEKMMRSSETDREISMLQRLDNIIRCLRVLYVSAGKGSLILNEVALDVSNNRQISLTHTTTIEHIRLLTVIAPNWLSVMKIRKKEYLKLNRNVDLNIVFGAVKTRQNTLISCQ